MKMTDGRIDNVCFDDNVNTVRADATLSECNRQFSVLGGYTVGYDEDTRDVLFFLPLEDLNKNPLKDIFLSNLRSSWNGANFKILEEREINNRTYFRVGFASLFFRLRSTI